MQVVYIDLIPQKVKPVIFASQYDNDRTVRFKLLENGESYTLDGTETVTVNIRKPDKNIVVITPSIGANNYVDVDLTEQACACFGISFGELSIVSGDTKIGTCNFDLDVEISPTYGGISSHTEIDNLTTQLEGIIGDAVEEIAPEVIEEIAPAIVEEIISDDYLTKDQTAELYYNKTEIGNRCYTKEETNNQISRSKPIVFTGILEAGETDVTIQTDITDISDCYIDVYASQTNVDYENITLEQDIHDRYKITVSFHDTFITDITIFLFIHDPTSYVIRTIST